MGIIKCQHCNVKLKNWDGIIVNDCIENKVEVYCVPCLMMANKEYDGFKRFEKVVDLSELFYNTDATLENLKEENGISNLGEWLKIIEEYKNENQFGLEKGPDEEWRKIGFRSEDDFYFDYFGESKKDVYEKKALEYLNYKKYFEMIIFLAKRTNGNDHRYFLITSKYEIISLLMEWFEGMGLSKKKEGYLDFINFVRVSVENIWKGLLSVEDSLYLVRLKYIEFLNEFEMVSLNVKQFEEYDKNIKKNKMRGDWK